MTVLRGFLITILSGVAFGVVGALIGYGLGVAAPDYYRIVFRMHPESQYDLPTFGLGVGLVQGAGVGIFVGVAIVLAVSWHDSRVPVRRPEETP